MTHGSLKNIYQGLWSGSIIERRDFPDRNNSRSRASTLPIFLLSPLDLFGARTSFSTNGYALSNITSTYVSRVDAGIRGNEGSARVEKQSGHDTMSAYVNSTEHCATSNPSRLDSRRHDSFECIPLDDRIHLSKDTVEYSLLEDEIFYRNENPGSVVENDSSSPISTPVLQDPNPLVKANKFWNHLRKRTNLFALGSEHWIGRVCLLSFYAVGLCE
jgi:hypothetical protein